MDRFDEFLSKYLPDYIGNPLVNEIIICDENGKDAEKIRKAHPDVSKLHVYVNENTLGPFLNKLQVCKKASNEWIVLMDSDNFADDKYFEIAKLYIDGQTFLTKCNILSPCHATPNFDYTKFQGSVITKQTTKKDHLTLMNTGNYVINKFLIDNICIEKEKDNIPNSSACDVIYFNTLLFEQFQDLQMHVVRDLKYLHVVHKGSIYALTHKTHRNFNETIYKRYNRLAS